jgi:endoglucanase
LGSYSAGGATDLESYKMWVNNLAKAIGDRKVIIVLEPDALAHIVDMGSREGEPRVSLIKYALHALKLNSSTFVYIDAGHPMWHSAEEIAARLLKANVDAADGFALNVSNFIDTKSNILYGEKVSSLIGGKHFIIDVSRNGLGPKKLANGSVEWYNPEGRALGVPPTVTTGHPLVDALLWIKRPGESDGECNGGPKAGAWWLEYALDLAKRAKW